MVWAVVPRELKMRTHFVRYVSLAAVLSVLVPRSASAQAQVVAGDASMERVLTVLEGDRATALQMVIGIGGSLAVEPERWPRPRVDSLAAGIVTLLLEEQQIRMTDHFAGILASEAPDGQTVGSSAQMVLLAEAAGSGERLSRTAIHRKMGAFSDDPSVVNWLVGVVRAPDSEMPERDRIAAIRALAVSERGRARLRLTHAQDQARGVRARAVLRDLVEKDFRGGGGEA